MCAQKIYSAYRISCLFCSEYRVVTWIYPVANEGLCWDFPLKGNNHDMFVTGWGVDPGCNENSHITAKQ